MQEQFKKLATDPRIFALMEEIGKRFGIHIDQVGELDAEVRKVILGQTKATDFTKTIQDILDIDPASSKKITEAINSDIMDVIRKEIQSTDNVSAVEKAGDFTIERPPAEQAAPVERTSATSKNLLADAIESKTDLIAGIEDPAPAEPRPAPEPAQEPIEEPAAAAPAPEPAPAPAEAAPEPIPEKKEPLVEQLLRGANAMPEQRVSRPAPQQPAQPRQQPPRPAGSDPYREAIE